MNSFVIHENFFVIKQNYMTFLIVPICCFEFFEEYEYIPVKEWQLWEMLCIIINS